MYQLTDSRDPEIVYQIKKAYNALLPPDKKGVRLEKKPYLDRL
jgi:hypothetical protein